MSDDRPGRGRIILGMTLMPAGLRLSRGLMWVVPLCVCLSGTTSVVAQDARSEASSEAAIGSEPGDDVVDEWVARTVAQGQGDVRPLRRRGAANSAEPSDRPTANKPNAGLVYLMGPMLIVLPLLGGAAFLFRRWLPRSHRSSGSGAISVVARQYLSPKQSLCLVKLGRRVLLLGVTPERVSPVAEISDPEEAAEVLSAAAQARPGSFTAMLGRLTEKDMPKELGSEPIEGRAPIASQQLATTGESIRGLVRRIRDLSRSPLPISGTERSAEPT